MLSKSHDTISFLNQIRLMSAVSAELRPFHIDLSTVNEIDLSAALALTAELDRWQRQKKLLLVPSTVAAWNPSVRDHLTTLGFFRILKTPLIDRGSGTNRNDWIQFISGEKTVGAAASLLRRKLERVFGSPTGIQMEIYGSLVEAMKNTFQHAYPIDDLSITERRWWMAGSVNLCRRQIRIVFLDQGITIPRSMPNSVLWKKKFEDLSDAHLVHEAMQYGISRLKLRHRGKGFSDICRPGLLHSENAVSVLSRGGLCLMDGVGTVVGIEVLHPFEGTLIEWYLNIP